jgi:hypothetical protein
MIILKVSLKVTDKRGLNELIFIQYLPVAGYSKKTIAYVKGWEL